jgi:hypothetical protein
MVLDVKFHSKRHWADIVTVMLKEIPIHSTNIFHK